MFVFRAVREVLYKVLKYSNVNRSCINILSNKNNFPIIVRESGKGFKFAILDDVVAIKA
jgi:nitrate/nitrite-specific signal transduction histidine kinase